LHLCTFARVKHNAILQFEQTEGVLKLRTFGAIVEFEEPFSASVEWLVGQSECNVASLPGLDNDQCHALLEKLREHDLISLY